MSKIFDRPFISGQHARRSPVPQAYRFLFDHAEEDTRARLSFLKEQPNNVAIHGRRFFENATSEFTHAERFKLTDDEGLQFFGTPEQSDNFDLIISLFSLHAVNDVPRALTNFKAALEPRGMLQACVFGAKTLVTLRQALAAAEQEIYGNVGARLYPFAEAPGWVGQLQNTGYALPVADSEIVTVHYRSLKGLLTDIRMMGEANGMVNRPRRPLFSKIIARTEEIYRELAPDPDNLLPADFEIIWLQGFKS